MRRTKIICTLGPSCRDEDSIENMIKSGMNVARLNFSHQSHDFHLENISTVKRVRERLGVPVAIMLDTKGPEIRTGLIKNGSVELTAGESFTLSSTAAEGDKNGCYVNYNRLAQFLKSGDRVLIDDGKIELRVEGIIGNDVKCLIVNGGILGNTRGVNIPDVKIDIPFLSDKDISDIKFGVENGIDYIAASFVRCRQDVFDMRALLNSIGGENIGIISKIESKYGVQNFDEILEASDGIMVARGDMGVEVPFEQLPGIQKQLILKCFKSGKPAITATQMLESMIENTRPTRAEINDVANAVFDSSSAVMLSGETAIGKNPPAVVAAMAKICESAENDAFRLGIYRRMGQPETSANATDAICTAAVTAAESIGADAVVAVTINGDTARLMSKHRQSIPVIGATDKRNVFNKLSLNWGITPLMTTPQNSTDELFEHAAATAVSKGIVHEGSTVVITAGSPVGISGKTNTLKIVQI